jgi:hypothetical protein
MMDEGHQDAQDACLQYSGMERACKVQANSIHRYATHE